MKLRVLGCSGGEMPGHRATSFLLDEKLVVDAGAITSSLSLKDQLKVDYVLISHAHLDHVKDLAMLADLVVGMRKKPIKVFTTPGTITTLRQHLFNNYLWPDFTSIPIREKPVIELQTMVPFREYKAGPFTFKAIPVNHPVEAMGFIIKSGSSTVVISGDTGETDLLWRNLNKLDKLDAILLETSFPNELQELADISGHLTPSAMEKELAKVRFTGVPVFIYHLKPAYEQQLVKEIRKVNNKNISILSLDQVLDL